MSPAISLEFIHQTYDHLGEVPDKGALVEILGLLSDHKRAVKELEDKVWDTLQSQIGEGNSFKSGNDLYVVKRKTKTKLKSIKGAFDLILSRNGSVDDVIDLLGSECFKPGAARKWLADDFEKCYDVTELPEMECKKIDLDWVK